MSFFIAKQQFDGDRIWTLPFRRVDEIVTKHSTFATIDAHEYLIIMGEILVENYELSLELFRQASKDVVGCSSLEALYLRPSSNDQSSEAFLPSCLYQNRDMQVVVNM